MLSIEEFEIQMNRLSNQREPFLFVIDFECRKPILIRLDQLDNSKFMYYIKGNTNIVCENKSKKIIPEVTEINPIAKNEYEKAFTYVQRQQYMGDSWLLNLTFFSGIKLNVSLKDAFFFSSSPYKLYIKDMDEEFVLFSPESFVTIENGLISSYPMKGTIDASVSDAQKKIIADEKEAAEHITITDLIRNDLSRVCDDVSVKRYRYVEEIISKGRNLLQVSSEICGVLAENYKTDLGSLLLQLLPAGSVSGAPKNKTLEIIRKAEKDKRGYYTGVFGLFDGMKLDSAVMIRYVEKKDGNCFFRSGGGITIYSDCDKEYREVIEKIYVPISRKH